jgi:iron complex outermembrane recepter protein
MFRVFLCVLSVILLAPFASYAQTAYPFDLPAQPLAESLRAVGHQTTTNVMFEPRLVKGLDAPALRTQTTPAEAIRLLLAGTKLTALQTAADTILIQRISTAEKSAPTSQAVAPSGTNGYTRLAQAESKPSESASPSDISAKTLKSPKEDRIELEEIIVVGTNIRGVYPASSPVEIYTAEDIARTGATTTEQFIQKLPQNFGTRSQYASTAVGTGARLDPQATAGVDLRGLGIGTSLALMNGRRLGLADFGRTADISMIPASAIDRVEVLTDGASAIYGSDAIGGVVNFVLRKDFDGAETRLSYGGVTSGGLSQGDFSQTFGRTWGSGNGLISYSAFLADPLEVTDRSYSARKQRGTLTPDEKRQNLLLTFSQDLGERFALSADLALARRDVKISSTTIMANPLNSRLDTNDSETDQIFANAALDYDFTQTLRGSFKATFSRTEAVQEGSRELYNAVTPTITSLVTRPKEYSGLDLTAMLEGALFALPGGGARFSLGVGVFDEEYNGNALISTATTSRVLSRATGYAFAEAFFPLIGADQNIPLVRRLELNLAARYTRYDDRSEPALSQDFGDAVDPKVGLVWAPIDALKLRASYGTSFRAPSLTELDQNGAFLQISESPTFRIPATTGQLATAISVAGSPQAGLGPETSTNYTIGFDFQPSWRPTLRVSASYYNISYEDRIGSPTTNGAAWIQTPDLYASAIYRPPSAAYIEALIRATPPGQRFSVPGVDVVNDPAGAAQILFNRPNEWILDTRTRNLAVSDQDGFDVAVNDSVKTNWGEVRYGGNVTRIFSYLQQNDLNSPIVPAIDRPAQPVSMRARTYLGFSRGGLGGTVSVNYADDYINSFVAGLTPIDKWTTVDLSVSYDFDATSSVLNGLRLSLSAQNLFDRDPPFVARSSTVAVITDDIGFDPTNANPLGRIVVIGVSKKW